MIEELVEETVGILENDFYSKKFYFSYSSITRLLYSPTVFYQTYVMGHRPDTREKHLVEGSVIHTLLLQPEEFNNIYIVSPSNIPKDPAKLVIDTVYSKNVRAIRRDPTLKLEEFEYSILKVLSNINLHQSLLKDSARLEKVITPQNESYFEFLKNKDKRELIDQETYSYCVSAVETIKSTPGVAKLLGLDVKPGDNIDVYNELYLQGDLINHSFGIKGYLDNLVIDHNKKMISINDFKTSAKSLDKFEEAVEFWSYWMQAAIYIQLVLINFPELVEQDYEFKFCFLVIDKYFNVYPFFVSSKTALEWNRRLFDEALKDVIYHYDKRKYNLPARFDQGLVKL